MGERRPRVVIVADDLIWQTRLVDAIRAAGATAERVRTVADLEGSLAAASRPAGVVIDMTARAYDPLGAIETAVRTGARVLAVGQHDDLALRKRALAAGAERVFAYRKLFEDGPATIERWLAAPVSATPAVRSR